MSTTAAPQKPPSYAHAAGASSAPPSSSSSSLAKAPPQPHAHPRPHPAPDHPRWGAPRPGQSKVHRHRPTTAHEEAHVYVLTLRLSPPLHDALNALRTRYFPAERLKVPAHLTLFHALPHSQLDHVVAVAGSVAHGTKPFRVTTGEAFLLGKNGVAVAPGRGTEQGARVHAQLREEWSGFLSKQDAKGFKAHWTVQNKVDDEDKVYAAFDEVKAWTREKGAEGEANGLVLWRYARGHWVFEREFLFGEAAAKGEDGR
ncbi:2'-5' RNA ligase superfamily-domain-containing protein [Rhodotorula diobovata]|uniref:2'-5' RNA ligase superfamily-domain-containing protein n=1 Tax=Rhodotorula diobovata TaxID=5288 RepID=A0A5C5G1W9_9BASI|nr:2'-5' RNA ligase superfamily-domain-containing protein [Rhodotorula diobovata]